MNNRRIQSWVKRRAQCEEGTISLFRADEPIQMKVLLLQPHKPVASSANRYSLTVMPRTAELLKLPVADRLALVDELLASVDEKEISLEAGQVHEARARWEELKANPSLGISYDELKKRLG